MGNPEFQPLTESTSLEIPTPKKAQIITQHTCTRVQNLVMITPPHSFTQRCVKMPTQILIFLPFLSLLYSCTPVGPKRLIRFLRLMTQNTWFDVRKCLLYDRAISNEFQGSLCPKNYRNSPQDTEMPAIFQTIVVIFYPLDHFS